MMSLTISMASPADLDEILALLTAVELPHEGVLEQVANFLVARDDQGLVGCAGLERYNRLGLLRSVAVSPASRHRGIGSRLTAALLKEAARAGLDEVVLLTTTARDFFAQGFAFIDAQRAVYDQRLAQSLEWKLPRCASAVCMVYRVRPPRRQ